MLTTLIPLSQLNLPPNLQNSEQIQPLVTAISLSNFVHQTLQKQPDLLAEWLAKFPTPDDCCNYTERLAKILARVENEEMLGGFCGNFATVNWLV